MTVAKVDMTAMPYVVDTAWPFVISIMPAHPDMAFFDSYFVKQRELLDRKQRWVHIVDTRVMSVPNASIRSSVAQHTKDITGLSARYNAGTATIFKGVLMRGTMTAVHWISPPPHPFANVGTPAEGVDFLRQCLQKEGIPVPLRMNAEFVESAAQRCGVLDSQ